MKIWQPKLNVPNFQISRDETLDNKPITFSENVLKLTYGNVEFQNFPENPRTPRSKGRERGVGGVEERRGVVRGGKEMGK
jgi:hypothetical protein